MASTDARPVPRKNVAYRIGFPIYNKDGTLITSWTGQDSTISKDGGNYADCTNEATEIQTSGTGYLDLTAEEMDADMVSVIVGVSNTDALPVVVVLYPQEDADIRVNLVQWRDTEPGNVDANGFVPANLAAVNGNTPRAAELADWLDNERLVNVETVTDKLDALIEDDGDSNWRYSEKALEEAPNGGGSGDVWNDDLSGSFAPDTAGAYQKSIYARTASIFAGSVFTMSQMSRTTLNARVYTTLLEVFTITDADTADEIWFTIKRFTSDTDDDALLHVSESGGLLRVNGEIAPDTSKASITTSGNTVTLDVDADIMGLLPVGVKGAWDVKYRGSDDNVFVAYGGDAQIVAVVTRAVE